MDGSLNCIMGRMRVMGPPVMDETPSPFDLVIAFQRLELVWNQDVWSSAIFLSFGLIKLKTNPPNTKLLSSVRIPCVTGQ